MKFYPHTDKAVQFQVTFCIVRYDWNGKKQQDLEIDLGFMTLSEAFEFAHHNNPQITSDDRLLIHDYDNWSLIELNPGELVLKPVTAEMIAEIGPKTLKVKQQPR